MLPANPRRPGVLDAHPLVRVYFKEELERARPQAWQEGNLRLYEHLKGAAPDRPETLEAMEPLFTAVVHGCRAGRQQEALAEVFRRRIQRDDELYSTRKLGGFGSDLAAMAGFFDHLWDQPSAGLTAADQAFVLITAAFRLRSLGRLAEAVSPFQAGLHGVIALEDWKSAAHAARNLSEVTMTLGEVGRAVAFGEQSVDLAERSSDAFLQVASRAMLADVLHQAGRWEESMEAFRKAEAILAEWQPTDLRLYSLLDHQRCDLLGLGEPEGGAGLAGHVAAPEEVGRFRQACREVQERAGPRLEWAIQKSFLHDIARDHLSLGRAHLSLALTTLGPATPSEEAEANFAEAAEHLDRAVDGLRQAGQELYIPRGLLARATLHRLRGDRAGAATDLSEALEIAERGEMRLHACDAHLAWAGLDLQHGDAAAAGKHAALARQLVNETGYGRREREVSWLERKLEVTEAHGV